MSDLSDIKARLAARMAERKQYDEAKASTSSNPNPSKTAEAIATRLAARAAATTPDVPEVASEVIGKSDVTVDMLNAQQAAAINLMRKGDSFVLIGAAGSGKTTTVRLGINEIAQNGKVGTIPPSMFTNVLSASGPAVAIVSYTNVAVRNIREILPKQYAAHCSTLHALLNYLPEEVEVEELDSDGHPTGETKTVQRFIPNYGVEPENGGSGLGNGLELPHLDVVVIEEAGSVPVWLYKTLISALPRPDETTFILLGDIQQLPPAFGDGILGFKQLELPVVALETTYRNVGLVTKFAHRVIEGRPIQDYELERWKDVSDDSGSIKLLPYAKRFTAEQAATVVGKHFKNLVLQERFHPDRAVLLIPYNKGFGTLELNRWIAQGFSELNQQPVYEVVAGFDRHYLSVGDRVMYQKQFCEIVEIVENEAYLGNQRPLPPSRLINRWGQVLPLNTDERRAIAEEEQSHSLQETTQKKTDDQIDKLLETHSDSIAEGTTRQASHIITVMIEGNPEHTKEIKTSGDINGLIFTYALTVYKSQGSEWETVYLALHNTHAKQLNRETIYTGVTRARRNLVVMYNDSNTVSSMKMSTFQRGIASQVIPGNSIKEKLEYFKRKLGVSEKKEELQKLMEKYGL